MGGEGACTYWNQLRRWIVEEMDCLGERIFGREILEERDS